MAGKERIRKALKKHDIYPVGEINACQIYRSHGGWFLQKFGENALCIGSTIADALEIIKLIAAERSER